MPVTPRGNSWQAQVNHKGERYRRLFETKKAAEKWEAESKARLLNGMHPEMGEDVKAKPGTIQTLGELVEHVYATHWAPMAGGQKALFNANAIVGAIGPNLPVQKLTRTHVDKARAALLAAGNGTATVNRKVSALSKALSVYADDNPGFARPKMERYKVAQGRIRRVSAEEEAQALAYLTHIGQDAMADYVALSLDTGLRQGEVLALLFRDCDDRKLTVWGTGAKSGKTRSVPLTKRAAETIARRRTGQKPGDLVLGGLNRWSVKHYWERLSAALGLQDDDHFVPHAMRHEFCSRLADRGLNAAVIKELAGHSSLAVTQIYIHVGAQALVDAIAALEDAQ